MKHAAFNWGVSHNIALCGSLGPVTRPQESIDCEDCRRVLDDLRKRYPSNWRYTDMRPTAQQRREFLEGMRADMEGA